MSCLKSENKKIERQEKKQNAATADLKLETPPPKKVSKLILRVVQLITRLPKTECLHLVRTT